ncbi:hypothetical protein [Couchioplanes caeruleus]|uniref:Uncharacterized protein n=1 Tax=Couchioplanes caeruleus subsp. caeruleus TaxID=56427 RepID=A0A1K0G6W2_9ACTN|nr:hypothetical protein [Couchioplanes caeruleus]OJF12994.1 hypothetical protein BG844_17630 [Couchioplanes caeruleus subsp. caeruleus]
MTITPTTLCFSTGQQIEEFLRMDTPITARQQLTHALAEPRLTSMSRPDLDQFIDRLSVRQAALIEHRRHQQRGGPRQPGTRGGVFRQKITDAEECSPPCSTNANSPPETFLPPPSTSASEPSTTLSLTHCPCFARATSLSNRPPTGSTPPSNFSTPSAASPIRYRTRRQLDSLQAHLIRNTFRLAATEHATKTDAEIADARNGGGGTIRPISK